MNNPELKARIDRVAEALEGIEGGLEEMLEEQALARDRADRAEARDIAIDLVRHGRAMTGWPWTPNTVTQGFLAGRWLRRDGDVYSAPAGRAVPGPNSPIRGGDDNQAKIDVPSGAPRA